MGTIFIFIRIFFFIVINNFIGLFPYVFTRRRHISFTLALALPLWLGSILMSIIYQYNNLLAHLVPVGTPRFLMPVMVVIETVSNIIRPLTFTINFIRVARSNFRIFKLNWFNTWLIFIVALRGCSGLYSILCIYDLKITIFK